MASNKTVQCDYPINDKIHKCNNTAHRFYVADKTGTYFARCQIHIILQLDFSVVPKVEYMIGKIIND